MPENPLLPNKQLRALHSLMRHCITLERKSKTQASREALLAATTLHLLPGDILCAAPNDATLADLAPASRAGLNKVSQANAGLVTPPNLKLTTAASIARGQLAASPTDALALTAVFASANTAEPGWQQALTTANTVLLPLVVIVTDTSGTRPSSSKTALTWANLSILGRRHKLAILAVDGEDAVAVYRCMQECVIRARNGCGPAVIWAVLTPPTQKLTPSRKPLARLTAYMKTRSIPLTA